MSHVRSKWGLGSELGGAAMVEVLNRRRVGPVDSIWLTMDRPTNLMVIDSVMWFDGNVDWHRFTSVVQRRLVDQFPVFHQHLTPGSWALAMPVWEDDPGFSLERHLHRATLPAPGDDEALRAYVETQMATPLDRAHPLWEMHLLDGHVGGSALVARIHHGVADGIALAQVLLSLSDATPDGDLLDSGEAMTRGGLEVPGIVVASPTRAMWSRPTGMSRPRGAVRLTRQTSHIVDKLLLGSNPPSPIRGVPGIAKSAVWSQPWELSDIKRICAATGATVNDVLMAAVSGAIASYVRLAGGDPADLTTMVPVNLRPAGVPLPRELGNKFALVMMPLPTGRKSPQARLVETKRRMDSIKTSPEALITFGIIDVIGRTHPRVAEKLVDFFAAKAIGVTTNVIGPMADRYVAGTRIAGVLGWGPGSGQQTLGVCIFTYNRTVRVGFKVDSTIVPNAHRLVEAFDQELADLTAPLRRS